MAVNTKRPRAQRMVLCRAVGGPETRIWRLIGTPVRQSYRSFPHLTVQLDQALSIASLGLVATRSADHCTHWKTTYQLFGVYVTRSGSAACATAELISRARGQFSSSLLQRLEIHIYPQHGLHRLS